MVIPYSCHAPRLLHMCMNAPTFLSPSIGDVLRTSMQFESQWCCLRNPQLGSERKNVRQFERSTAISGYRLITPAVVHADILKDIPKSGRKKTSAWGDI